MRTRIFAAAPAVAWALLSVGCCRCPQPEQAAAPAPAPTPTIVLPDSGFRAQITLLDQLSRLRAGEKRTINVRVKNTSDAAWPAKQGEELKGVVAVSNSWLDSDGNLLTNEDGRMGVIKGLQPGGEIELPLQITAPKEPGEYVLELDMVQELVAFFKEKGNETTKVKVKVE